VRPTKAATKRCCSEDWATEQRKYKRWRLGSAILAVLAVLIGVLMVATHFTDAASAVFVSVFILFFAVLGFFAARSDLQLKKKKWDEREETVARASAFTSAVQSVEDKLSLEYLSNTNSALMTSYHGIAKDQAELSFKNSQRAMVAGISLLLIGALVSFFPAGVLPRITVGVLSAVGAIISGFISRTFLLAHASAIAQLNRFFQQPVVNSYLLNAERVALKLDGQKDEVLGTIAQECIVSARYVINSDSTRLPRQARRGPSSSASGPEGDQLVS
jgi:hypothetical protein